MTPLAHRFRRNVLAELRRQRRSQGWLAATMGVHPTTVSHTLTNPRHIGITLGTVERYAAALEVDPTDLLTD